jgi:hypothetical protein
MVSTAEVQPDTGSGLANANVWLATPATPVYDELVPHASEMLWKSCVVSPTVSMVKLLMYTRCAKLNVTTYGFTLEGFQPCGVVPVPSMSEHWVPVLKLVAASGLPLWHVTPDTASATLSSHTGGGGEGGGLGGGLGCTGPNACSSQIDRKSTVARRTDM